MKEINGWIIYKKGSKYSSNAYDWMIEEGEKVGLSVKIMFQEDFNIIFHENGSSLLYDMKNIELPHFVLFRCYDSRLAEYFEIKGVKVFNSKNSMDLSLDKWRTHLVLNENNINMPKTILGTGREGYNFLIEELGEKFILKALRGSGGENVYLVKNENDFEKYISMLNNQEYIFQEFIEYSAGRDIRVYVIGNEVVASVERYSEENFRSNFALGGKAREINIDEDVKKLAVNAAKAVNLEIAGVDILYGYNKYFVCEINANAGFRTIWQCTKANIPQKIMEYISFIVTNM